MSPSPESALPTWFDPADPWVSTRMRQYTEILAAEAEIGRALTEALSKLLAAARAGGAVTASAGPWGLIWRALLGGVITLVLALFVRRFHLQNAADAELADRMGAQYARAVLDRLAAWPDQIADDIDAERAAGAAAGLTDEQILDRIEQILTIEAPSAAVRAEAERLRKTIDDPDTKPGVRREARRRLVALNRRTGPGTRRWQAKVTVAARTEAVAALNAGTDAGAATYARRTGQGRYRQWWSMEDTKVRAAHAAAHGQIRRSGETFVVGGFPMRFPGDPDAPADLVVNCRCSLLVLTAAQAQRETRRRLNPGRAVRAAADPEGGASMSDTTIAPEVEANAPATPDLLADGAAPPGAASQRWRGVLAPLGVRSGDRRVLLAPEDGVAATRDLPLPLLYQEMTSRGHDNSVVVGRIDRAWIEGDKLMGEGVFNLNRDTARDVVRDIEDGFHRWVSVSIDNATSSYRCYLGGEVTDCAELEQQLAAGEAAKSDVEEVEVADRWRLMSATLLAEPAFHEAAIGLIHDDEEDEPEVKDDTETPVEPATTDPGYAGKPDKTDDGEEDLPPWLRKKTKAVTASALRSAQDGPLPSQAPPIPEMSPLWKENPVKGASVRAPGLTAAAARSTSWCETVATAVPLEPSPDWFTDPLLTGPTKIRVTDEGRVFGHIAAWNSRHAAMPQITPPRATDKSYGRFHRHPVRCSDGTKIKTGPLATGGHADIDEAQIWAVQRHYDDPNFVVADVVCGEDAHGIWVAGALRYGVSPFQVMLIDRYSFSGDWREHELVAACAVSVPGFHLDDDASVVALAASAGASGRSTLAESLTRSRTDEGGEVVALIAAGIVAPSGVASGLRHALTVTLDSRQFAADMVEALRAADVLGTRVTATDPDPDEPSTPPSEPDVTAQVAGYRNRVHATKIAGYRHRVEGSVAR